MKIFISMFLITVSFFVTASVFAETKLTYKRYSGGQCHKLEPIKAVSLAKRVAFIVGNGAYRPDVGWLENASEDALAITHKMRELGFTVYLTTEASAALMNRCLEKALAHTDKFDLSVFFYSGHGVQVRDENYAVPVDVLKDELDVHRFFSIDNAISRLRQKSVVTVGVLDSCRTNPLKISTAQGLSVSTSVGRGLYASTGGQTNKNSELPKTTGEFIVAYATSPFSVAADGTGDHSPFTQALLSHLGRPSISLQQTLVEVAYAVGRDTDWQQTPFTRSSLTKFIRLNDKINYPLLSAQSKAFALESAGYLKKGLRHKAIAAALKGLPIKVSSQITTKHFFEANKALVLAFNAQIRHLSFDQDLVEPKLSANGKIAIGTVVDSKNAEFTKVWDTESLTELHSARATTSVLVNYAKTAVTQDGSRVAYVSGSKKTAAIGLDILDIKSGKLIHIDEALNNIHPMGSSAPQVVSMSFSPDGTKILVSGGNMRPVRVWNTVTGKLVTALDAKTMGLSSKAGMFGNPTKFVDDTKFCFVVTPYATNTPTIGVYSLVEKKTLWYRTAKNFKPTTHIGCSSDGEKVGVALYEKDTYAMRLKLFHSQKQESIIKSSKRYDWMALLFKKNSKILGVYDGNERILFDTSNGKEVVPQAQKRTVGVHSGLFSLEGRRVGILSPQMLSLREFFGHGLVFKELKLKALRELPQNLKQDVTANRIKTQ